MQTPTKNQKKRGWTSVEQEPQEVILAMLDEVLRRGPDMKRPSWVVVLDGTERDLELVLDIAYGKCRDVTIVLNFIHVLEDIWKAACSLLQVCSKKAADWVVERALEIMQRQTVHVAAEIHHSATVHKLSPGKRKAINKCSDCLEKYEVLMGYQDFLAQGLPSATGVTEGACRHLIKHRMELTGARWPLKIAEAVLRIRSLRSSEDLESYWAFHQAQEWERNHSRKCA